MEMHQIRYFLSVAKTLNFTRAAEDCHVAQPSLSRAIQKLEAEFGGELFRRERGLTHLTELGRLMISPLNRCLDSARAAKELAAGFNKDGAAPLRIAISNSIDLDLLQKPLCELVGAFPGLDLQLLRGSEAETGARLKNGDAEIAIACPLSDMWDRLESWELFCEGFQLVVHRSNPAAKKNALTIKQLGDLRLLARTYCEKFGLLGEALGKHNVSQEGVDTVTSDQDMGVLLATNIGVAIMPDSASLKDGLQAIKILDLDLSRPVTLYAVAGRKRTKAAAGFLNLMRSANWKKILEQRCGAVAE